MQKKKEREESEKREKKLVGKLVRIRVNIYYFSRTPTVVSEMAIETFNLLLFTDNYHLHEAHIKVESSNHWNWVPCK